MQNFGEWIKELFSMYIEYLKFWVIVEHYEEAVVLFFGKYNRTLKPGLHFKLILAEYSIAAHVKKDTMEVEAVSLTTLDGETIVIGLMIDFEITDVRLFLVETNDSLTNMRDIARGEMSDYLEDINWVDIKKKTTKNALKKLIAARYEGMGVKLNDLKFTDKCKTKIFKLFGDGKKQLNAIYS